ncbi:MAG TPA: TAT-variant-translocated molybdopterin oxidoreductase [Verrucomicrobiae bacterium]|jgi:molybdopterin-containing oxidoreductase family iron-sulfur binding subunit|nr:TAT-variant-translocated molybdopterin oxidoreductase [Verrucomicrobiae bacterium]
MKTPPPAPPIDLAAIRARLEGARGQQYWRSLDEISETAEFQEMLHREFPNGASEWDDGVSRRSFLKMAAASLALAGLTACTKQPVRKILPYVKQPEELVPGEPLFYATSMLLGGYATGVLATSREGHPIKVDGNPEHPASLGASSIWMQASILDLYDPDRSQAFVHNGEISSWADFISELNQLVREEEPRRGAGLRFLTETVTSPTLAGQFEALLKKFPQAKVHQFDSISRDNIREGARQAFGELVETQYRFDKAAVILSLESDFLYTHPNRLRYTRDFTDGRRVSAGKSEMNRLYVVESTPTVTGTMADHRLALGSGEIESVARAIAQQLGAGLNPGAETSQFADWLPALVQDLEKNRGRSVVLAGEGQPPAVHALCHWLNDKLGNAGKTVFYTESAEFHPSNQLESLRELKDEIESGAVETLFIFGGNPAYSAPVDFDLGAALAKVRRSIYVGTDLDETAAACTWHVPQAHYLEAWGDGKSFDGTISLQQPLIEPLYGGKSAHEILGAIFQQQPMRDDYEVVREHWQAEKKWPDFEKDWRRAVHDGVIANTALPEKQVSVKMEAITEALATEKKNAEGIEVVFRPDPSIWDGRFANNGWLQECARPVSKLTWDNAVILSPVLAQRNQLATNDVVELELNGRKIRGPVLIQPGQAENTVTLHLGYGRERVGRVGRGVGFNAGLLREAKSFWRGSGLKMTKLAGSYSLAATQTHHNLHNPERQIYREGDLGQFRDDPQFIKKTIESPPKEQTLYNTDEFKYEGYKWGMSIDLTSCIGCNACLLACNAENNIPVVGKEQVRKGREMYWIRIDTYYKGPLDNPEFSHMPVPCMQCEHAPCELVCPVEATVHDHEGLNLQIYNRCVGTRFCSNNCPYKVRRFNFLWYADYKTPSFKPMYNPDVTVRWRGVMEKCTYCIQRISRARITAEKENRRIRDGEIQSACQQACPANAIVFGDLNAPGSKVAALKSQPLDYSMLGELNTRPRTTYLAKLRNRNPEIKEGQMM